MNKQQLPPYFDSNFESIYGNFGARFAALLLDGLILAPMTIAVMIINNMDIFNIYYTFPLSTIITLFYYTFLPVKYGATPGKRLMGLRILTSEGDEIKFKQAFMRYLPSLLLSVIAISATIVAIQFADATTFNESKFLEKNAYLMELNPRMYYSEVALSNLFVFTNLILFLTNPRKRSISDFSGDTVVVYDRFLKRIKAFNNPTVSE